MVQSSHNSAIYNIGAHVCAVVTREPWNHDHGASDVWALTAYTQVSPGQDCDYEYYWPKFTKVGLFQTRGLFKSMDCNKHGISASCPYMQSRRRKNTQRLRAISPPKYKRALENCHRVQCKSLFNVADFVNVKSGPPPPLMQNLFGLMQSLLDLNIVIVNVITKIDVFVYVNHEFEINHLYDPSPSQNPAATLECTVNSA